jgi:hypothetical protein
MTDFTQMHVFFFIASVAAVILTIVLTLVLIYSIKILRDIKHISGKARAEADLISKDLSDLHDSVRSGGAKFKYFLSFLRNIYKHHKN